MDEQQYQPRTGASSRTWTSLLRPLGDRRKRIRPAVGHKGLALLRAALKRRCRTMALDIDAILDAEYVLITERCRTEGPICAVR